MTLEKFRISHSTLIEHYQFIEAHLEGIYAAISGKPLLEGLADVEKYNINRILNAIKKIESEKSITVFTEEEYTQIQNVLQRRNFWCHNCYYDMTFDIKTGGPKKEGDIQALLNDLSEAETLREKMFDKYREQRANRYNSSL